MTAIDDIDPAAPLRERLTRATEFLINRIGSGSRIHTIAREIFLECGPDSDFARAMNNNRARIIGAIADVMLPDRDRPPRPTADRRAPADVDDHRVARPHVRRQ